MIENEAVAPDCPLRHTARITLALSNLCPYKHMHAKCPASRVTQPQILPGSVVEDVLRTAAGWGWGETGTLAWHTYNEPTADPRLVHFCWLAKALMPHLHIHLWTNGWYLDEGLARELSQVGVSKLVVSTYSDAELARLRPLKRALRGYPTLIKVWKRPLDDRMETTGGGRARPCHAPLYDLTIYPTGKIGICCMDWNEQGTFGDLTKMSFADAMAEAFPMMTMYERELESKNRNLDVCMACRTRRGMFGYQAERKIAVDSPQPDGDTGV
ncbi:MAG: radical SAM/SPASM domain-containing protein [Planctomycetota bacterium]|jgi:hypothetical protein